MQAKQALRSQKKKGGRPAKTVKREHRITTRFSHPEQFILQHNAGKTGLSVSDYIRQTALTGKIIARLSVEDRHIVRQLIGMANNLNQLTKVANREGTTPIRNILAAILMQITNLLNQLQHGE